MSSSSGTSAEIQTWDIVKGIVTAYSGELGPKDLVISLEAQQGIILSLVFHINTSEKIHELLKGEEEVEVEIGDFYVDGDLYYASFA